MFLPDHPRRAAVLADLDDAPFCLRRLWWAYLSLPAAGSLVYLAVLGSAGVLAAYLVMRRGMRIVA